MNTETTVETTRIDALLALFQEGSFEENALFQDTMPETAELQPLLSLGINNGTEFMPSRKLRLSEDFLLVFPGQDISLDEKKLAELVEENNTGIEKKLNIVLQNNDDEEQKEYIKSTAYKAENCYDKNNPYAPKEDYKQIELMKPKEVEEEKSFLWK